MNELIIVKLIAFLFLFLFLFYYFRVSELVYINKMKEKLTNPEHLEWLQIHSDRANKMTLLAKFGYWFIMRNFKNEN